MSASRSGFPRARFAVPHACHLVHAIVCEISGPADESESAPDGGPREAAAAICASSAPQHRCSGAAHQVWYHSWWPTQGNTRLFSARSSWRHWCRTSAGKWGFQANGKPVLYSELAEMGSVRNENAKGNYLSPHTSEDCERSLRQQRGFGEAQEAGIVQGVRAPADGVLVACWYSWIPGCASGYLGC